MAIRERLIPWRQQPHQAVRPRDGWLRVYAPGITQRDAAGSANALTFGSCAIDPGAAGQALRVNAGSTVTTGEMVPDISAGITCVFVAEKIANISGGSDFLWGEHSTGNGPYNWGFYESAGNPTLVAFYVHNGTSAAAPQTAAGTWAAGGAPQVFVGTFGGAGDQNVRIYLNGYQTASAALTGSIQRNTGALLRSAYWNGSAPNFRLYVGAVTNRCMSATEVADKFGGVADAWNALFEPQRIWVPVMAAGNTYSASISESASAADSVSAVAGLAAVLSEAASATDSTAAEAVLNALLSESASAADALSGGLLLAALLAETASPADAVSAVLARVGALTESASGSDALTATATLAGALAEAANAADTLASTGALVATVAESASAADSVNWGGIGYSVSINEAANAAEAVSAVHSLVAALAEAAGAADAIASTVLATATVSELAAAADSLAAQLAVSLGIAEAADPADIMSGTSQQVHEVSVLEAASAVDAWLGTLPARVLAALQAVDGVRRLNDTRRGARLALGRRARNNGSTR